MNREIGGKVAADDSGGAQPGAGRGFTLVELLVVMGIIAILVSLLLPAITGVMVSVRGAATANVIKNLGFALETFRNDWGVYPPSDNTHPDKLIGVSTEAGTDAAFGYYNLFFALTGPEQRGWGASAQEPNQNKGPFGGTCTEVKPPYFLPEKASDRAWLDATGGTSHWGYVDAFKPGRPIFYFRYEPGDTNPYDANDNRPHTGFDVNAQWSFASQIHFEWLVKPTDPSGTRRWVREDYLLISCGADRYWGFVKQTGSGGTATIVPALTQADMAIATCDDVANFNYSR